MPASQAKSRWLIPRSRRHRRSMSPTVGLVCKSVMPRPQPRARAVGNDLSPNRPDDRGRGSWIHRPIAPVPTEVTMTIDTFPVPARPALGGGHDRRHGARLDRAHQPTGLVVVLAQAVLVLGFAVAKTVALRRGSIGRLACSRMATRCATGSRAEGRCGSRAGR
jgi:hypothetical protein